MTEDEAKTKWCPMLRTSRDEAGYCIGSACMVWRERRVPMRENHAWDENGQPKQIVTGWCGLGGDPQ